MPWTPSSLLTVGFRSSHAVPAAAPAVPAANLPEPEPVARTSGAREIISDEEVFLYIKKTSRDSYKSAWQLFRSTYPDIQHEFEERTPSEKELLNYFVAMREGRELPDGKKEEGRAASTILTTYSLVNGVLKHKYSFNMNKYPRIVARMKVWQSRGREEKGSCVHSRRVEEVLQVGRVAGGILRS